MAQIPPKNTSRVGGNSKDRRRQRREILRGEAISSQFQTPSSSGPGVSANPPNADKKSAHFEALSRSSIESYTAIVITVIVGVVPMTSFLRVGFLLLLVPVFVDVVRHSRWTLKLSSATKALIVGVLILILAFLFWRPIAAQYAQENSTNAKTDQSQSSSPAADLRAPKHLRSPGEARNGYSDELPGTWVDLVRNVFYRFKSNGKVEYRFHRFDDASVLSGDMTWYRIGQTVHFQETGLSTESCEGRLNGDVVLGFCNTSVGRLKWSLRQLDNQPPPQKAKKIPPRKPEATDGIWVDDNLRGGGKPVFVEFLSSGKVRKRYGIDGYAFLAQDTWYRLGESIRLTEFISNGTFECDGKPQGEMIEGVCRDIANSDQSFVWKMERVKR